MTEEELQSVKKSIIAIGHLLWLKDLVGGLNGNISVRLDENTLLLTAHGTCLGLLQGKDLLTVDLEGKVLGEGNVSTENLLHTSIYKNYPEARAVIHTHTTYTNAYFLENETITPRIFESKFYLGDVKAVPQATPAVTDPEPVMDALRNNNIAVLRNHGVVAKGEELFDCFLLVQALEEAVKIDAISRLYSSGQRSEVSSQEQAESTPTASKKYKLFSQEQIDEIVQLVNNDAQLQSLGEKTAMTMDLGVHLNETGETFSFCFENGKITKVGNTDEVEFFITAPENIWRAVFNQEIDPFVATTQKKMHLRGDFAKISKWYAPCSRLFELWSQVPVE